MSHTVGSLCSGFGGLDLGLERAGFTIAWHVENDAACAALLEQRWPGVPNHHDLKATDWSTVEPVDLICGGYPCPAFSQAARGRNVAPEPVALHASGHRCSAPSARAPRERRCPPWARVSWCPH